MKRKKRLNREKKDWGMVKKIGLVVLFLLVICGISYGVVIAVKYINEKVMEAHLNDEDWLAEHVTITKIISQVIAFIQLIILKDMNHMI